MTIAKEHIVERQGKTFVLYAGLLSEAHDQGLIAMETEIKQLPNASNDQTAVVVARVTLEKNVDGGLVTKQFTGIGDASPISVTKMMLPHLIRMAETRAKARALRDAINVGTTALEELGDQVVTEDDDIDWDRNRNAGQPNATPPAPDARVQAAKQFFGDDHKPAAASDDKASKAQVGLIYGMGTKELGWSEDEVDAEAFARHGGKPAELTKKEASTFIDYLKTQK